MGLLEMKKPQIREKRLNTLGAYLGDVNTLLEDFRNNNVKQRVRTFSQNTLDEIIHILGLISTIYDAVTVIHGPRGCGAAQLYFNLVEESTNRLAITNLNEKDTILGGEEKLRDAIISLYRRYRPRIVFIVSTPVVAINNDDIQAVVEELQDELGVIVVPIYSDGFKSKNGITGYDVALHAFAKVLVSTEKETPGAFVNLIAVSENLADIKEIKGLLNQLGLEVNILPRFANANNFSKASQAKISISIDPDNSDYLGKALEEKYKIPFLQPSIPIGQKGTEEWLLAVAEAIGLKDLAKELSLKGKNDLIALIEEKPFNNIKVYLSLPTATTFGLVNLLEELGAEVVGITVPHLDNLHENNLANLLVKKPDLKIHVAQGQPFEEASILQRIKPDLYIGGFGQQVWAAKFGIAAISLEGISILGFQGITRFVHRLKKAIKNKAFVQKLAKNTNLPYQDNWYNKSSNWYIKQEVK